MVLLIVEDRHKFSLWGGVGVAVGVLVGIGVFVGGGGGRGVFVGGAGGLVGPSSGFLHFKHFFVLLHPGQLKTLLSTSSSPPEQLSLSSNPLGQLPLTSQIVVQLPYWVQTPFTTFLQGRQHPAKLQLGPLHVLEQAQDSCFQ